MLFENIKIEYKIKMLKGEYKGQTITLILDLDDLEYQDITSFLIEKKYLKCSINHEEHEVISRRIIKN